VKETGLGMQPVLYLDHEDVWGKILHDALNLFAIYREYRKKNKRQPWLTN
jgi:hypothetical protein